MSDNYGLKRAAELGVKLGEVGHRIVLDNDQVRIWDVKLEPGEATDFHIHHHPYTVISLGGGDNEVETIFGDRRATFEPAGETIFIDAMRPVHRLTNKSNVTYRSRLVELKQVTWKPEPAPAPPAVLPADALQAFREFLVHTADMQWVEKSLAGLSHKMLWRNDDSGASIGLVRFEKGAGVPEAHAHASNQFMYCLAGRYRYIPTGTTLTPGTFYCNPKGSVHGPTTADETSIMLEIYDGPHYPVRPSWYSNDADAR
jgi:quercetin dioxygenase-like cupin family protein